MQTIRPNHNQVFAKPDDAEKKTASGILLTEAAEKPKTAVVINVGSDVTSVRPDDRFVYKPYTITDIKLNNEDYLLISDEDILGVVLDVTA